MEDTGAPISQGKDAAGKRKGVVTGKTRVKGDPEALQRRGVPLSEPVPCWSRERGTLRGPFFDKLFLALRDKQNHNQ